MKKKLPDYTKKSWNSLSDLKNKITQDGKEKIVSFDGASLVTEHRCFRLAFGELKVYE